MRTHYDSDQPHAQGQPKRRILSRLENILSLTRTGIGSLALVFIMLLTLLPAGTVRAMAAEAGGGNIENFDDGPDNDGITNDEKPVIHGKISVEGTGEPGKFLSVYLYDETTDTQLLGTTSLGDGTYSFANADPDFTHALRIVLDGEDYGYRCTPVLLRANTVTSETCEVNIVVEVLIGTIEGYAYLDDDPTTPLPGAKITLTGVHGEEGSTETDADGYYKFENIRAMKYRSIEAEYKINDDISAIAEVGNFKLNENDTMEQDLTLTTKGWVKGWVADVLDDGNEAPGAVVTVMNAKGDIKGTGTCDGDGNYRINDLPAGKYTAYAEYQGRTSGIQSFDITPLNGVQINFSIPAPAPTYHVQLPSAGDADTHGSVTADKTEATEGETVTLTVSPEAGYDVGGVTVQTDTGDPVEVKDNGNGTWSFTMPASGVTADVKFVEHKTPSPPSEGSSGSSGSSSHSVTVTKPEHGKVTASRTHPSAGTAVTLTVAPDEGYDVGGIAVQANDGSSVEVKDNGDGTWSFTMPASAVTVSVEFVKHKYSIQLPDNEAPDAHGSVTADNTEAAEGETVTLTVSPEAGYDVDSVTVQDANGSPVEVKDNGDGTWSFTMPASGVTADVRFVEHKTPSTPSQAPVPNAPRAPLAPIPATGRTLSSGRRCWAFA